MYELIDRYIYHVTRRLPFKDREEVGAELRSTIFDMLGNKRSDTDIMAVLNELGSPAALAGKYRRAPRFLMTSPALYGQYTYMLKRTVSVAGATGVLIGTSVGSVMARLFGADVVETVFLLMSAALAAGAAGALLAVLTVTACFVIAERAGYRPGAKGLQTKDLPPIPKRARSDISQKACLVGMALTICSFFGYFFRHYRDYPFPFAIDAQTREPLYIFPSEITDALLVLFFTVFALLFISFLIKFQTGRRIPAVLIFDALASLSVAGIALYIVTRAEIFTWEYLLYLDAVKSGEISGNFRVSSLDNPTQTLGYWIAVFFMAALAICADSGFRLVRAHAAKKRAARGDESRV